MSTLEFNTLVGNHSQTLRGYAIQYTKNWDDAEDLIQDTLLKALRYKDHFEEGTNFKGWIFTIMRNIFINGYKRKKLQMSLLENVKSESAMIAGRVSENTIATEINTKEIMKAINQLSPEYKKPFQMILDGYHYEEIAQEMNIPIGTVKSRIFHARQKLSTQLSDFR
ncbi:MAG: hypothetical protein RL106_1099 [Bacteroidota bacterium]|jgi:RNA polymerase sigma-70 factor (ECF subfamily)